MKKVTVEQIKSKLKKVIHVSDPYLQKLKTDPRKGVRVALKSCYRRLSRLKQFRKSFQKRLTFERRLRRNGYQNIAGIDEVGRGPLAGPVVTCAVILPRNFDLLRVNDSKQLSRKRREWLYPKILAEAIDFSIGIGSPRLIDAVNIYQADRIAMRKAILGLEKEPDYIIVDAMNIPVQIPQLKLYHGDARSVSVGAASIVAKVYRDHLMEKYDRKYPEYDFKDNVGYGTAKHLKALKKYGATVIHRRSFEPVKKVLK